MEERKETHRVFLYFRMDSVSNMPPNEIGSRYELHLSHARNTITKLQDHYTTDTFIDMSIFDVYQPTFSVLLEKDNINELNTFSDSPVMITLYKHLLPKPPKQKTKTKSTELLNDEEIAEESAENFESSNSTEYTDNFEEEEENAEEYEPIAQGHIDMMQFFRTKRTMAKISIFLYGLQRDDAMPMQTVKSYWDIYSLLPLVPHLDFCNMAFLSFESIYNPTSDLLNNHETLTADLLFQSKLPNDENEYDTIKICSYKLFQQCVIAQQLPNLQWESIKNEMNLNTLTVQSGCQVTMHKLLQNLFGTEGVNFGYADINTLEDEALVCNSLHRYVLTKEMCYALQDAVAFDLHQIVVHIYRSEEPEKILLRGIIDLSILLYPHVNACRFAVELKSAVMPAVKTNKDTPLGKTTAKKKLASAGTEKESTPAKVTFCIINICLLSPITETHTSISGYNESTNKRDKLKLCVNNLSDTLLPTFSTVCEETYKEFNEVTVTLIEHIIQNHITDISDDKSYFCCQLRNMVNRLVRVIACDFNVRYPTNSTIEFTNLLTRVYDELLRRIYKIIQDCKEDSISNCFLADSRTAGKLIYYYNQIKYMHEVNDQELYNFYYDKLKLAYPANHLLYFYEFIFNMERQQFDAAKEYFARPLNDKIANCQYATELCKIYIDYVETLQNEQTYNEALENLLWALKDFVNLYPKEVDGYILLYCYFKQCYYLPGMSYTRWRFEQLYLQNMRPMPDMPSSRWDFYCAHCVLTFNSLRSDCFYNVMKNCVNCGMYKFGETIFQQLQNECTDCERYLLTTTFKILLNNVEPKFVLKNFSTDKLLNGAFLKASVYFTNGNIEFKRENVNAAMQQYSRVLEMSDVDDDNDFQLAYLRLAYYSMANNDIENAVNAFETSLNSSQTGVTSHFGLGKALYLLGRLKDAIAHFAKCTKYHMHIPDVWGYLALCNLKLGKNFNALECWKYAKLDPKTQIHESICQELDKIDYKDVNLYVDIPTSLQ